MCRRSQFEARLSLAHSPCHRFLHSCLLKNPYLPYLCGMAPNYGHVRTNWVSCELPCVGPPAAREDTHEDKVASARRWTTAECVFLTATQISSGTLSIPAKRAEAIFSLACAESDAEARVVVATEHVDLYEAEHGEESGDNGGSGEDGISNVLIPIREPFSPSMIKGQTALPPSCVTPLTHTIRDDNKVVVWDSSARKGYLAKLRKFASQPTQVFLNGLFPLFDGLKVTARCVVCFFPTGVLGHAHAVVGYAGADDGVYARVAAGVVHEWGASGVWKGNGGEGLGRVIGLDGQDGGDGDNTWVGNIERVRLVPLQGILRVRTVAADGRRDALRVDGKQNHSIDSREVAVVDARFGCFVRNVKHDIEAPAACRAESPRVTVVDSCALSRSAYLRRRAIGGSSRPGDSGMRTWATTSQSRARKRPGHTQDSENGPPPGFCNAKDTRGPEPDSTLSSERRALGVVNEQRVDRGDDGQKTGSTTLILKQRRRRNARKATKPIWTL